MTSSGVPIRTTFRRNLYCKKWNAVRVCHVDQARQISDSIVTFEIVTFEQVITVIMESGTRFVIVSSTALLATSDNEDGAVKIFADGGSSPSKVVADRKEEEAAAASSSSSTSVGGTGSSSVPVLLFDIFAAPPIQEKNWVSVTL